MPATRSRPLLARLGGVVVAAALLAPVLPVLAASAAPAPARTGSDKIRAVALPKQELKRKDLRIPRKSKSSPDRMTAHDGTQAAIVSEPGPGAPTSTWNVTYTGFDAGTNPSGPAAKLAFQAAVDVWARIVASPIPIKVNAHFEAQPPNVLGSARATSGYSCPCLGDGISAYPSALADVLNNADIAPAASDIEASFTTDESLSHFYYGTDGAPGAGQVDFESVVLHELGHGLGFAGSMVILANGNGHYATTPSIFDRSPYDAATAGALVLSQPNDSTALAAVLTSGSVYWGGANGVTANGGARPRMYAPPTFESGSTYSHLDEATYGLGNASSLMTPQISAQEVIHSPGPLAVGVLKDEGWTASLPPATAPAAPGNVTATGGNASAQVAWTAPSSNGSPITSYNVVSTPDGLGCSINGTGCTVTGLTNGTAYTFAVTATNAIGTGPASAASNSVTPASVDDLLPANITPPTVTGTASVLQRLTAHQGSWTQTPTGYSYAWQRCDANGTSCITIDRATSSSYRLLDADLGHTVRVLETAANASGPGSPAASSLSALVAATPATSPVTYGVAPGTGTQAGVGASQLVLDVSPSGTLLAVANQVENNVRVFSLSASGALTALGSPYPTINQPETVTFNPAGTRLAVGSETGLLAMYAVSAGGTLTSVAGSPFSGLNVVGQTWSPDGAFLAGGNYTDTGGVFVYAISPSGAPSLVVGSPFPAPHGATALAYDPSGRFLAVITYFGNTLHLFATHPDGSLTTLSVSELGTDPQSPFSVAWSPGGGQLAFSTSPAGGGAMGINMRLVSPTGQLSTVPGSPFSDPEAGLSYAFAPEGGVLATSGLGTSWRSVAPDGAVGDLPGSPVPAACYQFFPCFTNVVYSPDSSLLVTGDSHEGTLIVMRRGPNAVVTAPVAGGSYPLGSAVPTSFACADSAAGTGISSCVDSNGAAGSPGAGQLDTALSGAHSYTVTATSADGLASTRTMSYTVTGGSPPSAPGNVTATRTPYTGGSVNVSWSASTTNGSAITGYTVTPSPSGTPVTVGPGATGAVVAGLTNGTSYTFSVAASSSAGSSSPATSAAVIPGALPGNPTAVTVTAGNGSAGLTWSPPASDGGRPITSYFAIASPGSSACLAYGVTSCTVPGLTNGTTYTFSVYAGNEVGYSTGSAATAGVTPTADVPTEPRFVSATRQSGAATVSWTVPASSGASPVTGYTVTAQPGGQTCSTAASTACQVTGLTNGAAYRFTVTAANTAGNSSPSDPSAAVTPATVPDAPTAVGVATGNGAVTVTWTAPTNGGSAITGYTATSSPDAKTCTTTGATTCLVTGLTNGTSYTFTVTATNSVGTGTGSTASGAVVPVQTFTDVPPSSAFAADIDWLVHQGIATGFADGSFHPVQAVTRQAFAAFLYRYAHAGADAGACAPGTSSFPDVPDSSPFCGDIKWLASTAITGGFADGGFHPAAVVARQATAAFFYRFNHGGADAGPCAAGTSAFNDVPDGSPFCGDIKWLAATAPQAITTGFADGGFHPAVAVARQAAAAYFHRYATDFA